MVQQKNTSKKPEVTKGRSAQYYALLVLLCFGLWLILSLDAEPAALIVGFLFAVAAGALSFKSFYLSHREHKRRFFPRVHLLLWYLIVLLIQSYISSFTLIKRMLTGRYNPKVVRIRTKLQSPLGRAILANTISMIPGTLSMWMDGKHIYVHCFDIDTTHSIDAGRRIKERQEKLLKRIFG